MVDHPAPPADSSTFNLRRTALMRAVGGPLFQGLLLLFAVIGLATAPFSSQPVANLAGGIVALILWLPGVFAVVRIDDLGIHRRCYRVSTDRWADISQIELRVQAFGLQGARPVIRKRRGSGRRHHLLTPACGLNTAVDEFALRLLAVAAERGIAVDSQAWEPRLSRLPPQS